MLKSIEGKFLGMKRADEFVVYPFKPGELIVVQGSRSIGKFDPVTGEGVLNWKGSKPKYFMHLSAFLGAEPFHFPADFVEKAIQAQPQSGDHIGAGVYIA